MEVNSNEMLKSMGWTVRKKDSDDSCYLINPHEIIVRKNQFEIW